MSNILEVCDNIYRTSMTDNLGFYWFPRWNPAAIFSSSQSITGGGNCYYRCCGHHVRLLASLRIPHRHVSDNYHSPCVPLTWTGLLQFEIKFTWQLSLSSPCPPPPFPPPSVPIRIRPKPAMYATPATASTSQFVGDFRRQLFGSFALLTEGNPPLWKHYSVTRPVSLQR